jgi:superfamily II DNA or RNA helicase
VPDVVYHTLTVEFTKPHLKQYRQVRDQYRDDTTNHIYGSAIEKIHALRRLTLCEEKINTVKGLLDDTLVNGEGYLLYCHYIDSAHQWADTLGAICITGETPARERLALAKANRKVVATVGSLAEGGDLTHLKTLVYAEEDYVAGPITQTIGRVVRPTQNMAPVNVYYVMVKGTIDVTIHKCSQARIVDAEQVMEQELL